MSGFGNERDQQRRKKRLNALLRLDENRTCCECGQRQPQWASVNLGVFFCIRCSGIHRNLGVHISVVRSVTLDSWKEEWVKVLEQIGNQKGLTYWEYKDPGASKPTESVSDRQLEQFIRDKYIVGKWKGPETVSPYVASNQSSVSSSSQQQQQQVVGNSNSNKPVVTSNTAKNLSTNSVQNLSRQPSSISTISSTSTTTTLSTARSGTGRTIAQQPLKKQISAAPSTSSNVAVKPSQQTAPAVAAAPAPAFDPFGNLNENTLQQASQSHDNFASFFDIGNTSTTTTTNPSASSSSFSQSQQQQQQQSQSRAQQQNSANQFDALFGLSAPAFNQHTSAPSAVAPAATAAPVQTTASATNTQSSDPFSLLYQPNALKSGTDSILDLYNTQPSAQQQQQQQLQQQQQMQLQQQQQLQRQQLPQQQVYQAYPQYGNPYASPQQSWGGQFGQLNYSAPAQQQQQQQNNNNNNSNVFTGLF